MKCSVSHLPALLSALVVLTVLPVSCGDPHDVSLESYDVTSLSLNGLRGVDAVLSLEINNPSVKMKVSNICGAVRRDSVTLASFAAEDFTLKPNCTEVYPLNCTMTLDKGVGLLDILNAVKNFKTSDITVDLSADVSHWPVKRNVVRSGIPVKKLLDR